VTDRGAHVADVGLGAAQVLLAWSRDGRWAFAAAGVDLVVVDATTGTAARVEVTLPPFEALFAV
jgi:hypothetical protein